MVFFPQPFQVMIWTKTGTFCIQRCALNSSAFKDLERDIQPPLQKISALQFPLSFEFRSLNSDSRIHETSRNSGYEISWEKKADGCNALLGLSCKSSDEVDGGLCDHCSEFLHSCHSFSHSFSTGLMQENSPKILYINSHKSGKIALLGV